MVKQKPILIVLVVPILVWAILLGGNYLMQHVHIPLITQTLTNPGFEDGELGGPLHGWNTTGPARAFTIESGAYTGQFRLTQLGVDVPVEAWQTLKGLDNSWYTLRAWVRSSGDQKTAYITLKDCGSAEQQVSVPVAPADKWVHIVISNQVTNGQCTIGLGSEAGEKEWISFDDVEFVPGRAYLSIMGADVSSLKNRRTKVVYILMKMEHLAMHYKSSKPMV
jgi:arabinogalactan endo-1,4-beta-galactosidase